MVWLVGANAAGIFFFAVLQGFGVGHALIEGGVVAVLAVMGALGRRDRRIGASAVALGLLTASAMAVHLSHGAIEAHFHFFVMIAVLTLYEDWLPFLIAAAYVLLHHGVGGAVSPGKVYNHADAEAHPWKWALIHASFIAGAGAANVLAWRLHENTRGHLRRLATIVESSQDAILSISSAGAVQSWNDGARRVFGWEAGDVVDGPLDVLISPELPGERADFMDRVLAGEHLVDFETIWRHRDGHDLTVRVSASPLREGNTVVGASAIVQDITEQRQTSDQLELERTRLTEAEKIGQMGSWEWDCVADEITWSAQLYRLFGLDRDEFDANLEAYSALVHPDDRPAFERYLERIIATRRFEPLEHRITRPDGTVRHVFVRGEVLVDDRGDVVRMVGTSVDITDQKVAESVLKESQEALAHQALHDALTGLPNRTLLSDRLRQALHRARRNGSQIALLFLDIDRFKLVNDSLGHGAGDELLMQISGRLDSALRPADTVARFGGDEFAVLCEDVQREQDGIAMAERIMSSMNRPFDLAGREVFVTASVGVAVSAHAGSAENLLRDADVAMYRAKERGRGRYELFDAAMRQRSVERMQTENELRQALTRGELELHYQPIVSLEGRTVVGAEALIRWHHPERGLLAPGAFIPVAEESSLILALGEWVLVEASRQLSAWEEALPDEFMLTVNVSARQFSDGSIIDVTRKALENAGADPRRLSLELTESVLMSQENAFDTLVGLQKLGVGVVLDDFGTGYSSLSYLSRFPLNGLKVDRSFVARMQEGSPEHAIVAAVGTMADSMHLEVVAEGIETEAQLAALTGLGYQLGQGFLFAKPIPPEEFLALIRPGQMARTVTARPAL